MSAETGIEWTDSTWNPVRGCSRVSEGCRNCYAEKVAARFSWPPSLPQEYGDRGGPYHGFATAKGWTGKVGLVEHHLLDPLHWRKPRRIFVNSMSDLFHEGLPMEAIARVFAVMALAGRHTFQVLTKRPLRMQSLLSERGDHPPASFLSHVGRLCEHYAETVERQSAGAMMGFDAWWQGIEEKGYLPNVWLGVSAEDQARADERIPLLLQTPAAVRFVSAEPLLGAVDFVRWIGQRCPRRCEATFVEADCDDCHGSGWIYPVVGPPDPRLDWIIAGGESGPGARPCDVRWLESIRDQCRAAAVPVFIKQMGSNLMVPNDRILDRWPGEAAPEASYEPDHQGELCRLRLIDTKGGDPSEWPEDLRVRDFPRKAVRA